MNRLSKSISYVEIELQMDVSTELRNGSESLKTLCNLPDSRTDFSVAISNRSCS
jgi:hypothetical protein